MAATKKTTKKATRAKKTSAGKKTSEAKKSSSTRKKATTAKKQTRTRKAGTAEVTVDRRSSQDRRATSDRRKKDAPVPVERRKLQRRTKVARRRQIDPTTCERDYTNDEVEFMNALDEYKRQSGRMFPTCSEVLEVIRKLGYEKRSDGQLPRHPTPGSAPEFVPQHVQTTNAV